MKGGRGDFEKWCGVRCRGIDGSIVVQGSVFVSGNQGVGIRI